MATRLKRIPDKITLVSRPLSKRYDLALEGPNDFQDTYPVDSSNKKRLESARDWAGFKQTSGRYSHTSQRGTYTEQEVDNVPRLYRIINLEHRGEGGRAYKVSDLENRVYDLREDALVDSWKIAGMNAGGELNAEFVWTLQGTEMKLCVVGSKTHEDLIAEDAKFEYDESSGLNKISTTTKYEFGKAYSTPSGDDKFIYLGPHPTLDKKHIWVEYFHYVHTSGGLYVSGSLTFTNKIPRVVVNDPAIASIPLKDFLDKATDSDRERIATYEKILLKPPTYYTEHENARDNIKRSKGYIAAWHDTRVKYGLPV